ncbi:MAG: hypothetical protein PHY99_02035, partial [Bacteroidales bacterium]|nr:hypothetical protein [Bacteroidales bacterium]
MRVRNYKNSVNCALTISYMITKTQIQFIRSLDQKKNRDESSCFIAEGDKLVREALELPKGGRFQ